MKLRRLTPAIAGLLVLAAAWTGCKKSGPPAEAKITGGPGDPPIAMPQIWSTTNRYSFRFDGISASDVPARAIARTAQHETTMGQDYTISVANGGRRLDMEIQSVQLDSTRGEDMTFSFDSEFQTGGFDENRVLEALSRIKGSRLGFVLTASNSVLRVDGMKEFADSLGPRTRSTNVSSSSTKGPAAVRLLFGPKFFEELIEFNVLPPGEVRIGDTWSVTREVLASHALSTSGNSSSSGNANGTFIAELDCTFKGWQERDKRKCALIEFTGTLANKPRPRANIRNFAGNGPGITTGDISGRSWYFPEWNQPVETYYNEKYNYTFNGRLFRGTNSAMKTLTNHINVHASFKLVDVTAAEAAK